MKKKNFYGNSNIRSIFAAQENNKGEFRIYYCHICNEAFTSNNYTEWAYCPICGSDLIKKYKKGGDTQ